MNFRRRLGSWTAAIGLIPLGVVESTIAPPTAGIPVITLEYRIFHVIAGILSPRRREGSLLRLFTHHRNVYVTEVSNFLE